MAHTHHCQQSGNNSTMALLFTLFFAMAVLGEEMTPLIAKKELVAPSSKIYGVGEPFQIKVTLYNTGDVPATDINIKNMWPDSLNIIQGPRVCLFC
jgi:hypothetical protein